MSQLTFIPRQPINLSFSQDNLLPSVQTSLKETSVDLTKATEIVSLYRNKSKIFILINANGFNAYCDGGYKALQYSPGSYNKLTFQVHGDEDICDVFREIWCW
ncbi:hypothetical protein LOK49_LG03G01855 [Camellia lanceoleosa]|uniref:Uncharacterized protein n=1 Tax=Camellia lanceoleosa TaxID=1840588 RepID=A0ACC0I9T8_9ERIC|nr:hypothetical protein LOK49_LG03G01855 [Camellia lanceoleosa]